MASQQPSVMRSIQQLFHQGPVAGLNDGELLERFVSRHDEAAFAALVALHRPLVLGVCGRILHNPHDIEDAFQATFLVLVRRAGSIRDAGRLGPWLHGVARRVAMRARSEAARRRSHHREPPNVAEEDVMRPGRQAERDDLLAIIDQEVDRLPSSFRDAVVLSDLEGRSYAEAALRLRCPLGTLQSRLARGRARLRARLIRRGVAPVALGAFLAQGASAAVPEALAAATVRSAVASAIGKTAMAATVSATAAALASSVTRSMLMSMIQRVVLVFAAVSIAIGAGLVARDARQDAPAPPPAAQVGQPLPAEEPKPGRALKITIVSKADGSPLPGATVWVRVVRGKAHTWEGTTDDEGHYEVDLPGESPHLLDVRAAHDGYAPGWLRSAADRTSYTLPLALPETIGGIVQDEQGRPIEGAQVFPGGYGFDAFWPEIYASPNSELVIATTDAQGRWQSDALPVDVPPDSELRVLVTHPDHVTKEWRTTAGKARDRSNVQVLKTGVSVSGTVLSPFGRPVPMAIVEIGTPRWNGTFLRVTTDKDGQFRTGLCFEPSRSPLVLMVQAPGLAQTVREILVTTEVPPQVIKLTRRRPIEGRVIDAQGRPVVGTLVSSGRPGFLGVLGWAADTDADGRFTWYDAPTTGTILLKVSKPSFRPVNDRPLDPGAGDVTITLHRPQHLHGTVTDAETGRPIERFTLIRGWGPPLPFMRPEWRRDPQNTRPFTSGRYDWSSHQAPDENGTSSIRIEAEGYLPGEFLGFPDNSEDVAHDFQLRRGPRPATISGVVLGPDGRPLAGAEIVPGEFGDGIRMQDGRLHYFRDGERKSPAVWIKTDRDGRYSFAARGEKIWLAVVHEAGFALRSPEQRAGSADVTLAPWGRIEGVVKLGATTATSERVSAWLDEPGFGGLIQYDTQTDQDGHFFFDRVVPGRLTIFRPVHDRDGDVMVLSHKTDVQVAPGQTLRITIGGNGRPVIGRLAFPEGASMSQFVSRHVILRTRTVALPVPADFLSFDDEQWMAWWNGFRRSRECRDYFEGERQYAVVLDPDGTFRIEDVPAGRYVLELPFRGGAGADSSARLAFARVDVVVPGVPGGRSDVPLDLGAVPLSVFPFREPNVGDRVPEIALKAADGRPLDLAALRGKFVLLAFWASRWSMHTLPHLKATHDAFGRDPRFVMIGLNQDFAPEARRWCVAHHHLDWEHRYLGSFEDPNPIAAAFGVRYPIKVFLIGPDGRIVAKDLQGDQIKQAVAAALSKEPRGPK